MFHLQFLHFIDFNNGSIVTEMSKGGYFYSLTRVRETVEVKKESKLTIECTALSHSPIIAELKGFTLIRRADNHREQRGIH